MSKQIIIAVASLAFWMNSAHAEPPFHPGLRFLPYIGADYQYINVDYKNVAALGDPISSSLHGGNIHLGARVHRYLGFELGYFATTNSNKSNSLSDSSIRVTGWTGDTLVYIPLGESERFELIATAGIVRQHSDGWISVGGSGYTGSGWGTRARFGGGAEYWLTDSLNMRGLVRFQPENRLVDHVIVTNVGLNYQF